MVIIVGFSLNSMGMIILPLLLLLVKYHVHVGGEQFNRNAHVIIIPQFLVQVGILTLSLFGERRRGGSIFDLLGDHSLLRTQFSAAFFLLMMVVIEGS